MATKRVTFAYRFSFIFTIGMVFLVLSSVFSVEGDLNYFFWIAAISLLLSAWYGFMAILEWVEKISNE